ncbi:MAG: acetyl-CoA carboxylase carboxyl transferase subunit beta [Caldisericaceae bacterium]|nr:acetyl-CoA carboxylase carboxyl transferase subunit beta [Caldisericaceae bacterium]
MNIFGKKKKIVLPVIQGDGQDVKVRCNSCGRLIDYDTLKENYKICPYCGYHFRMSATERISVLADKGTFDELGEPIQSVDVLNFTDTVPYKKRLADLKDTVGLPNAILAGSGKIGGIQCAIGVFAFEFLNGTLGSATGEKLAELIRFAGKNSLPLVVVFSSAGERVQEGIFSLMQVAKTVSALNAYKEKEGSLFISVLTNPVLGGVASIAMAGDVIIAESGSYVGVSGPRISEYVMKRSLPKEAQKVENLMKRGFVDIITDRKGLKDTIIRILKFQNKWGKL